jgi:L-ribulose-5-phosphate 4-epimerase
MNTKLLREQVYEANMELTRRGLVLYTFGNASQIDRDSGIVAIKPSGVSYDTLTPEQIVLVDLDNRIVEGTLRPSSDVKTHLHLYRCWPTIGGVVHTHSSAATAWAQACRPLPCYGTTYADYVYGAVPCTALIGDAQIARDYEHETGEQITAVIDAVQCMRTPMVLVAGHGPFSWGSDAAEAVYHAAILEELARMGAMTEALNPTITSLKHSILDKHYLRKHGTSAYYGQPGDHR